MTPNEKEAAPKDPEVRDAQFFAAIGYLSFLCFVPLALKKNNKFALFHGKQALVLFILELAAAILKAIPALGDLVFTLAFVVFGILSLIDEQKKFFEVNDSYLSAQHNRLMALITLESAAAAELNGGMQ